MAAPTSDDLVPEVINVREFLEGWGAVMSSFETREEDRRETKAIVRETMNISEDMFNELESVCSPSTLRCGLEPSELDDMLTEFNPEVKLLAVRLQEHNVKRRQKDTSFRNKVGRRMRYKHVDTIAPYWLSAHKTTERPEKLIQTPDVVLSVIIYKPYRKTRHTRLTMDSEYLVLGRQCLTVLRDRFTCVADYAIPGELSNHPDLQSDIRAKDLFKSGTFFIEGTFYNDTRDASSRDYSDPIITWAAEKGIGNFDKKKMEDTTFLDLSLCLGQPYVYIHQGDCEHLVVFTDLRMLNPSDNHNPDNYPMVISKTAPRQNKKCAVCQKYAPKWLVTDSPFAPEDPSFCCDPCFRSLYYDENGHKIGDFKAYLHVDNPAVK